MDLDSFSSSPGSPRAPHRHHHRPPTNGKTTLSDHNRSFQLPVNLVSHSLTCASRCERLPVTSPSSSSYDFGIVATRSNSLKFEAVSKLTKQSKREHLFMDSLNTKHRKIDSSQFELLVGYLCDSDIRLVPLHRFPIVLCRTRRTPA